MQKMYPITIPTHIKLRRLYRRQQGGLFQRQAVGTWDPSHCLAIQARGAIFLAGVCIPFRLGVSYFSLGTGSRLTDLPARLATVSYFLSRLNPVLVISRCLKVYIS